MEFLIGVLAAWGGIMLIWTLIGIALLPMTRRQDTRLTVVLRAEGSGQRLEQYIKGLFWIRDMGLLWWDVAVLRDHLTEEGQNRAQQLTKKENHTAVIFADELIDWMER